MKAGFIRWFLWGVVAVVVVACQKEIVAPGTCPQTCPGGEPQVFDTVINALSNMDSTFTGYVQAGAGVALLVSEGVPNLEARAVVRFLPRGDSLVVNDTARSFSIDSIGFRVGLLARDTTIPGLEIDLYRIPVDVADTGVTFAQLDPLLTDSTLIGSVAIPDSVFSDGFRFIAADSATLAKLQIPPADSGVMAIAMSMTASQGTGASLGSLSAGGLGPLFQTFVKADSVADTTMIEQTISRIVSFNTFVLENPGTPTDSVLTVGGAPSSRSIVRFDLPSNLAFRDSAQLVRATLQVVPLVPIPGIPGDSATLVIQGVQADLGAKSTLCSLNLGTLCGTTFITTFMEAPVLTGSTDTLRIEIIDLIRGWQDDPTPAQALFLRITPEAATFSRPELGSTRTPGFEPLILLTYALPFPFEER